MEELVAWIEQSIRPGARVTIDERILDRDTGSPRQIDVAIRMTSGHDTWLGIVEVRDRGKPVDVRYIEEVLSKRSSVKADVACIVSATGFSKAALEKASRNAIRTLTYAEARENDWSDWLGIKCFVVHELVHEHAVITLGSMEWPNELLVADSVVDGMNANPEAMIITDEAGRELASLKMMIEAIIDAVVEELFGDVPLSGEVVHKTFIVRGPFGGDPQVLNQAGVAERIGAVKIEFDLFHRFTEYPLKVHRYSKSGAGTVVEVVESVIDQGERKMRFELLAETDGASIGGGRALKLRTSFVEDEVERNVSRGEITDEVIGGLADDSLPPVAT